MNEIDEKICKDLDELIESLMSVKDGEMTDEEESKFAFDALGKFLIVNIGDAPLSSLFCINDSIKGCNPECCLAVDRFVNAVSTMHDVIGAENTAQVIKSIEGDIEELIKEKIKKELNKIIEKIKEK